MRGIYGLVDPRDGRVRYIGQSEDIEKRYKQHCALRDFSRRRLALCMELGGQLLSLRIIEEMPRGDLDEAERRWIAHYRRLDQADTNVADGGSHATSQQWQRLLIAADEAAESLGTLADASLPCLGASACDLIMKLRTKVWNFGSRCLDAATDDGYRGIR